MQDKFCNIDDIPILILADKEGTLKKALEAVVKTHS
jgi:hypothetical protein